MRAALASFLFLTPLFTFAQSATGLPADCHVATALEARSAPNIIAGKTRVCSTDAALGINATSGQAAQDLPLRAVRIARRTHSANPSGDGRCAETG